MPGKDDFSFTQVEAFENGVTVVAADPAAPVKLVTDASLLKIGTVAELEAVGNAEWQFACANSDAEAAALAASKWRTVSSGTTRSIWSFDPQMNVYVKSVAGATIQWTAWGFYKLPQR